MLIEKLAHVLHCNPDIFGPCTTEEEATQSYLEVCYLVMSAGSVPAVMAFQKKLREQHLTPQEEHSVSTYTSTYSLEAIRHKQINWQLVALLYGDNAVTRMQEYTEPYDTWDSWWYTRNKSGKGSIYENRQT